MNLQFAIANIDRLWPYGLLLLLFLLVSLQSELTKSRFFDALILGVPLFFAGFREIMTPDLERYREAYDSIGAGNSIGIEPSFVLLSTLLNKLELDYHALFFSYTFITLLFIYLGIRNFTKQVKFSFLLYTLIPSCFLNLFVEMRGACSVAIAFYATSIFIYKGKKFRVLKTIVLATISVLFHYSAIVYWVIFVILHKIIAKRHSRFVYLAVLGGSILIPTSLVIGLIQVTVYPFLGAQYQGYINAFLFLETNLAEHGQLLKSLIYTGMAACFILWGANSEKEESEQLFINLFVIGVVIVNIMRSFAALSRVAYFFLIFQIILWPLIVTKMTNYSRALTATYSIFLFYLAQFAWGLFLYSEETGSYVYLHYQNFIFGALQGTLAR